jgi:hypothetical protein
MYLQYNSTVLLPTETAHFPSIVASRALPGDVTSCFLVTGPCIYLLRSFLYEHRTALNVEYVIFDWTTSKRADMGNPSIWAIERNCRMY